MNRKSSCYTRLRWKDKRKIPALSRMGSAFLTTRSVSRIALIACAPVLLVTPRVSAAASATYAVGKGPQGVVSDGVDIWVANQTDNTVTKLSASTGAAIGTYTVGSRPTSLVFDGAHIWVVNAADNSVTELLASTGATVGTYPVGSNPGGIVFDGANIWVTTSTFTSGAGNPSGGVTELLASTGATVGTYLVGIRPAGIVFDGAYLWVTDTYDSNLRKLSAATGAVVATYPAGQSPLGYNGILFDGVNLWVANYSSSGTATKILAATGAIINAYQAGPTTLTSPGGLAFDGVNLWVTDVVGGAVTELLASTGARVGTYAVGSFPEAVAIDGADVWVTNSLGNTVTRISPGNPPATPLITTISPVSASAGAPALALIVNGSGFVYGDSVVWSAASPTPLVTTWVSPSLLSAQVPASLLAAGSAVQITVTSPSGGTSNASTFAITPPSTATPVIASFSPSSATAGNPAVTITIGGTGFTAGAIALWNGLTLSTNFVNPSTLTAQIPAADLANQGAGQIVVVNPNGAESNAIAFVVSAPANSVAISSGGVVNAASFVPEISPGSIISIFGNNLSSAESNTYTAPLPTSSNGTVVTVNGIPAPLLYVSPTLINAQVPVDAGTGRALVAAAYNGTSTSALASIEAASPGFFFNAANSVNLAIAQHLDGTFVTPASPAQSGEIVAVYGTGIGPINPTPPSGQAAGFYPNLSVSESSYAVTVNGAHAPVGYLGLTPSLVGVMQLNIQIPNSPTTGNLPLSLFVDGGQSQGNIDIPVAAIAPALTYTFDFSPTSLTGEEIVTYTVSAPTQPGDQSLNIASGSPFSQTGFRGTDGTWTFTNSQDPSGLLFGAVLYYSWSASATTAFPNIPGTYSGIPAVATVTCNTAAGSACIGGIDFGLLHVGTAAGIVTVTIH
jgi:uncharacterized protein (TIGR03437 family)